MGKNTVLEKPFAQMPSEVEAPEVDFKQVLMLLWGGRGLLVAFALAAAFIGVIYAHNITPRYQTNTLIQLENRGEALGMTSAVSELSQQSSRSVTEIQIINSRMVLGAAVADLRLDWSVTPLKLPYLGNLYHSYNIPTPNWDALAPYPRSGETLRLDLLEVPSDWLGQAINIEVIGAQSYEMTLPDGNVVMGRVGVAVTDSDTGYTVRIGEIAAAAGREFIIRQIPILSAINQLRGGLNVQEQGRGSGILRMTMEGTDREQIKRSLDAVTRAYVAQNAQRSSAEAASGLAFIDRQLPSARAAVEAAANALTEVQRERNTQQLSLAGNSLLTQVFAIAQQLKEVEVAKEQLQELYTTSHPEFQQLLEQEAELNRQLDGLSGELDQLPADERELIALQREFEAAQAAYAELQNRAQALEVLQASDVGNVRIIDPAAGSNYVAPNKQSIIAIASAIGIVLAMAIVFLQYFLRNTIRGAEDLEALGLAVFGTINQSEIIKPSKKNRKQKRLPLLALEQPKDVTTEAFRSLRTSLHFGLIDASNKTVMVTSAAPGAGKSFICANLAIVASEAGQRVCLVDADMRRGTQRKYYGWDKDTTGLSDVLSGQAECEDALIDGPVSGLRLLPAGAVPPNPAELLMRPKFKEMLNWMNAEFDLVIIDVPPVLAVTDPVIVGRSAGATLVAARFDGTSPQEMEALEQTLANAKVKIAGAILNGFDPKSRASRYGSRYGYSYGYNYRYDYKSGK